MRPKVRLLQLMDKKNLFICRAYMRLAFTCEISLTFVVSCGCIKTWKWDSDVDTIPWSWMVGQTISSDLKALFKVSKGFCLHPSLSAAGSEELQAGQFTQNALRLTHLLDQINIQSECTRHATFEDAQNSWFQLTIFVKTIISFILRAVHRLSSVISSWKDVINTNYS